ncbi:hypothetical protein V8G54_037026 [Vigna mungo]|uniref:Pentatricopeptide repeat-containing protein n=1 Tax=Vigna mungo TaxID=3915 RepID=A0AAQ3RG48_VIGMU
MGVTPDVVTYNSLVDVYCKGREIEKAYKVLEEMREQDLSPDVIMYTCMIGGLGLIGQPDKSRDVLKEMKEYGCYPDVGTYNAAIRNFCIAKRIGDANGLVEEMFVDIELRHHHQHFPLHLSSPRNLRGGPVRVRITYRTTSLEPSSIKWSSELRFFHARQQISISDFTELIEDHTLIQRSVAAGDYTAVLQHWAVAALLAREYCGPGP